MSEQTPSISILEYILAFYSKETEFADIGTATLSYGRKTGPVLCTNDLDRCAHNDERKTNLGQS